MYSNNLIQNLGDCPNVETETSGGKVFWQTVDTRNGFCLQKKCMTGHCRILDDSNVRVAWGSESVMREKLRRLTGESFLEPGDVIGVTRTSALELYDHYAVYLGDGQVIHYAGDQNDFSRDIVIHKADISEFLKTENNYFVLYFEGKRYAPKKIFRNSNLFVKDEVYLNQLIYEGNSEFELFSPSETIARAESRLGETAYNLVTNNCEHFALWCKTGLSTSFQVKRVIYRMINRYAAAGKSVKRLE